MKQSHLKKLKRNQDKHVNFTALIFPIAVSKVKFDNVCPRMLAKLQKFFESTFRIFESCDHLKMYSNRLPNMKDDYSMPKYLD